VLTTRDRLLTFFVVRPDEELLISDICLKFACSNRTAWNALKQMVEDGLIAETRSGKGRGGPKTYSIGPVLKKWLAL